jgi:hypothetical protein
MSTAWQDVAIDAITADQAVNVDNSTGPSTTQRLLREIIGFKAQAAGTVTVLTKDQGKQGVQSPTTRAIPVLAGDYVPLRCVQIYSVTTLNANQLILFYADH